jgi:alpha-mannosidase
MYLWSVIILTMKVPLLHRHQRISVAFKSCNGNNEGGDLPVAAAGVQLSMKGVVITAFGKNPDGEGTILRLWEQAGNSGLCTITLPARHPYKTASLLQSPRRTTIERIQGKQHN